MVEVPIFSKLMRWKIAENPSISFSKTDSECFGGDVTAGKAGSAGRNHDINARIGYPSLQVGGDGAFVVGDDFPRCHDVARVPHARFQRIARGVIGTRSRIRHGEDGDADRNEFVRRHGVSEPPTRP